MVQISERGGRAAAEDRGRGEPDEANRVVPRGAAVTTTTAPRSDYRLDLDGLRGVAIALVVAFHIWFGRVSGGVDIFLVLSGFFFTGMLLRQAQRQGRVGVWATVRRTARRLLPALLLVLAAVVVLTMTQRPYTQWGDFSGQVLASALYYQNWYLADAAADYLAADPSVSPLQHLWSMAVQGQFYLAITLLLAAVAWWGRRTGRPTLIKPLVAGIALVLGVSSFLYATLGSRTFQEWIYYDSAARAWELLVGALLAVALPSLRFPDRRWVRWLLSLLAVAGLVAVVTCGMLFDGARQFPGPAALFPVGAAVVLIVAGMPLASGWRPLGSRVLAARPAVELGTIAYALYLWHWPLLIFFLIQTERSAAGLYGGLAIILVSLVLAVLTNRFVEEPLRLRSRVPAVSSVWLRRCATALVTVVGVVALGASGIWQGVIWAHPPRALEPLDPIPYPGARALVAGAPVPDAPLRPSLLEASGDRPAPSEQGCIADWYTTEVVTCDYGDQSAARTIALVGNSHAEHWLPALDIVGRAHGVRIRVFLKMGCNLNIREDAMYRGLHIPDCRDWSRDVLDQLGQQRPDWIFTTATVPRWPIGGDETPEEFVEVWEEYAARGLHVMAIRDTPWLRTEKGHRYRANHCLAKGGNPASCGMSRSEVFSPVNPALEPAARFPNMRLLDLSDAVCRPTICRVTEGNVLIYHDEHHLSATYSRTLAPEVGRHIGAITGWW